MSTAKSGVMKREWFEQWFDTKYYHILYKNRDFAEARRFIDNLLTFLKPPKDSTILDLACGKGRFSRYLAEKGFDVTGLDLSVQSIEYARQFETDRLHFFDHDMRLSFRANHFNYIFNFFTSFGYFENEEAHRQTLISVMRDLRKDGVFVLDFLNIIKVERHLKRREQKTVNGICFKIRRKIKAGYIVKTIRFNDKGKSYQFEERVRAFSINDFQQLFNEAGLEITQLFGNYSLESFDENHSNRLIIVAKKR